MHLLWFIIIGIIAGWLAGVIVRGSGYGIAGDLVVGVIGAIVGGFILRVFGVQAYSGWGSFITAVIGAIVLIVVVRAIAGHRHGHA
jgi:uncharacterized membrane protein YeaQ/YmgE (transglycosylase-associated protein family)